MTNTISILDKRFIILFSIICIANYISWILLIPLFTIYILLFILKKTISKKLLLILSIPTLLIILGLLSTSTTYIIKDILRDFVYYIQPILILVSGYFFAYKIRNLEEVIKIFILLGIVFSFFHFIDIALHPEYLTSNDDIFKDRIKSSFVVPLALSLLLINMKYKIIHISSKKNLLFLLILSLSVFLNFSRTMIIVAAIIYIIGANVIKFNIKTFIIGLVSTISIFAILNFMTISNNGERSLLTKFTHSIEEVTLSNYTSEKDINENWRGYESFRGYLAFQNDGTVIEKIFGYGFGKSATLGITIKLGGNYFSSITRFHNGYIDILLKCGIIGLISIVTFFLVLFFKFYSFNKVINKDYNYIQNNIIASISVILLITTYIISGWLNYSANIPFIFLLAILLNLSHRTNIDNLNNNRNKV